MDKKKNNFIKEVKEIPVEKIEPEKEIKMIWTVHPKKGRIQVPDPNQGAKNE